MNSRPISKTAHGLIDYAFAAALFSVPKAIGCKPKTVNLYRGIAAEVFLYGAMSKHKLAPLPLIPMKVHKVIDIVNLSMLSLLTSYKGIRKNPKAVCFNLTMVAMGITAVLLTRWKKHT
ncbi:hypothetical protein [Pedobacter deserti]|uniref:hypothetical protein n=1 Tax=Pedobacter deserti TaxID=2817382 RepID=UPI00210E611F|nr:hypothetical protein [Pedobacter sp. SYSU D00382]